MTQRRRPEIKCCLFCTKKKCFFLISYAVRPPNGITQYNYIVKCEACGMEYRVSTIRKREDDEVVKELEA